MTTAASAFIMAPHAEKGLCPLHLGAFLRCFRKAYKKAHPGLNYQRFPQVGLAKFWELAALRQSTIFLLDLGRKSKF